MNIVIMEPLGISDALLQKQLEPLRTAGHQVTVYSDRPSSVEESIQRAKNAEILILTNSPFPARAVDACPCLRYLDVAFTGIDHIAVESCRARNILISNASGYSDQAVAELTIGMMLSLLRRMPACDKAVRSGESSKGLTGRELGGRTVGIIGFGRIGQRVARLCQAFDARVIASDPAPSETAQALGIPYLPLEELLRTSDIVTLHAPSTPATAGMIGAQQLALMRPSALFINCARGALVDQQALCDALNEGRIAGAAADVFPPEPPLPADAPLLHARNVVLTPHVAFSTEESMLRRAKIIFENLDAYLSGTPIRLC